MPSSDQTPSEQQKLFEKGLSLFSQRKYTESLEIFQQINHQPLLVLKHYYLGLAYVQLGLLEKALKSYRKIREIPRSIEGVEYDRIMYGLYINMGSVLQNLAKKHGKSYYKEAKECYRYALEINDSDERVWNNLGNVNLELELYNDAIEAFNNALGVNPEFAEAYYCLSLAYEFQGNYQKAIENLQIELKYKSKNKTVLNRLAGLLFGTGKFDEALKYAEILIKNHPTDKNGLKNLALIHYNLQNYESAFQFYKKLLQHHPKIDLRDSNPIFQDLEKRMS